MSYQSACRYICVELPSSKQFVSFVSKLSSVLHPWVPSVESLKNVSGSHSGFYNLPGCFADAAAALSAAQQEEAYTIIRRTASFLASGSGALKWLASVGSIAVLTPHLKSLSYLGSACATFNMSCTLIEQGRKLHAIWFKGERWGDERRENAQKLALDATISLCNVWLISMGGLTTYVGSEMKSKGLKPITSWTFSAIGLIITSTNITRALIKALKE